MEAAGPDGRGDATHSANRPAGGNGRRRRDCRDLAKGPRRGVSPARAKRGPDSSKPDAPEPGSRSVAAQSGNRQVGGGWRRFLDVFDWPRDQRRDADPARAKRGPDSPKPDAPEPGSRSVAAQSGNRQVGGGWRRFLYVLDWPRDQRCGTVPARARRSPAFSTPAGRRPALVACAAAAGALASAAGGTMAQGSVAALCGLVFGPAILVLLATVVERDIACMFSAKPGKRYGYGHKTHLATTHEMQVVTVAIALPGAPYDGHSLEEVLMASERVTGIAPETAFVDRGYRGHNAESAKVCIAGMHKGLSEEDIEGLKTRPRIEASIGYMKQSGHLGLCRLKGRQGDSVNAVLCGAAYNIRKAMIWIEREAAQQN